MNENGAREAPRDGSSASSLPPGIRRQVTHRTDGTKVEILLPEELIVNPAGKAYCTVCKVTVPHGPMNVKQHVEGRRHDVNRKRLGKTGKPPGAGVAVQSLAETPIPIPTSTPAPVSVPNKEDEDDDSMEEGEEREIDSEDSESDENESDVEEKEKELSLNELKAFKIDKKYFLESLLAERESEAESDDEIDSGANMNVVAEIKIEDRQGGFAPIQYEWAGGPDLFLDSVVPETEAKNTAGKIKSVLESGRTGDQADPSTRKAKVDNTEYIELEKPGVDDNMGPELPSKTEAGIPNGAAKATISTGQHPEDLPPWLIGPDASEIVKHHPDPTVALHHEILEFARFMAPTKEEEESRKRLLDGLDEIVRSLFPNAVLEVFGSYATDLYLPSSDIDICIMNTPKEGDISELYLLAQAIRNRKGFARRVNVIKAKVPLVKIVSATSRIQCDISFNRSNGPKNVPMIRSFLSTYPALRPLTLVVKCLLQQRALNEVYTGGVGSYTLLMMIVSHLRMSQYNFPSSPQNLGSILQNFFRFYGRKLNYVVAGLKIKGQCGYFEKSEKYTTINSEAKRISVEDPQDETNELGRNSYAWHRVRKTFESACSQLCRWNRANPRDPITPLKTILRVDPHLSARAEPVISHWKSLSQLNLYAKIRADTNSGAEASTMHDASRAAQEKQWRTDHLRRNGEKRKFNKYKDREPRPKRGRYGDGSEGHGPRYRNGRTNYDDRYYGVNSASNVNPHANQRGNMSGVPHMNPQMQQHFQEQQHLQQMQMEQIQYLMSPSGPTGQQYYQDMAQPSMMAPMSMGQNNALPNNPFPNNPFPNNPFPNNALPNNALPNNAPRGTWQAGRRDLRQGLRQNRGRESHKGDNFDRRKGKRRRPGY